MFLVCTYKLSGLLLLKFSSNPTLLISFYLEFLFIVYRVSGGGGGGGGVLNARCWHFGMLSGRWLGVREGEFVSVACVCIRNFGSGLVKV